MNVLLDTLKWSVIVGAAALALTLLKPLLDRRYSPQWRYGVWLAMAALLLAGPALGALLEERTAALPPAVVIEVPQMELRVSREEGVSLRRPESGAPAGGGARTPLPVQTAPGAGRSLDLDVLLPGLWLLGAAVFALYHLAGTLIFQRRARRWSRPVRTETAEIYASVCRELGMRSAPALAVSSAADSPMVLGLLRPRLLLPGEDWGEGELRFILRHELIHFRRRDLWYKLLILLANAVHWFNPLIYLMAREAARDVELTCDALVVAGADPETRRAYSEALLSSIRRQRGLSRSALSTHFYGGAQVMRERFRNILGRRGRRWGAAVLALTLLITVAAACAVGLNQTSGPQALTEAELSQWQEKLNSEEWNGFLSQMYTDVRCLNPEDLFYDGAGIARPATEAELAALEARGEPIELDVIAMDVSDIDQYLKDHAGITRGDFAAGAWTGGADETSWRDLEDTHFAVHGDTNFVVVTVTGGTREGDTVTLEVEADQNVQSSFSNGLTAGTLTLADGKVRSFTTPLHAAAEQAALELMDSDAEVIASYTDEPPVFEEKYISDLSCVERVEAEGKSYYIWYLGYRMLPDDMGKVLLAGGMSEENGWVTESSSMGRPVLILSAEGGSIAVEETTWTSVASEEGFTWEEYACCRLHYGMELTGILNGWPEVDGTFLNSLAAGHETWALEWEDVAHSYLAARGQEAAAELTVLRTFQSGNPSHDQSLLVQADCGVNTAVLLLTRVLFYGAQVPIWQVNGAAWSGAAPPETAAPGEAPGDPLIHQTDFALTGGQWGTVSLYGQEQEYGWGVSRAEVALADGITCTLPVRDALALLGEEGERTEAWNADGGLILRDLNFDGYADIGLQAATPAYNQPYLFWLYNPDSGQYEFAFWLLNPPIVDSANRELICESRNGTTYYTEYYLYDPSGTLYLVQRDAVEYSETGSAPLGTEFFETAAGDWRGGSYRELTADELESIAYHFNDGNTGDRNSSYARARNGLLRFPYERFSDISHYLEILFYDAGESVTDEAERAAVEERIGEPLETDCKRLDRAFILEFLGWDFAEAPNREELERMLEEDLSLPNLAEYDAFYLVHGDTMMTSYQFDRGVRTSEGTMKLYYRTDLFVYDGSGEMDILWDQSMCATVRLVGQDTWGVLSNVAVE